MDSTECEVHEVTVWQAYTGCGNFYWNYLSYELVNEAGTLISASSMDVDFLNTSSEHLYYLPDGCYTLTAVFNSPNLECGTGNWGVSFPGGETWTSGFETITFSTGDQTCSSGCMDPMACNFQPEANTNFDCSYDCIGCTNPSACNFQSENTIEDGSCQFGGNLLVRVFNDHNMNGLFNYGINPDIGLNFWKVTIPEFELLAYTDHSGIIQFNSLPAGEFSVIVEPLDDNWAPISPLSQSVNMLECEDQALNFAFSPDEGANLIAEHYSRFSKEIHCEDGWETGIWINNLLPEPLFGSATIQLAAGLEFDTLNVIGDLPPNVVTDSLMSWELNGEFESGELATLATRIKGPGIEALNDSYEILIDLVVESEYGDTISIKQWLLNPGVTCNLELPFKSAAFDGFGEAHYILKQDSIEYTIRFQNDGSTTAKKITIVDELDISLLDPQSFQPIVASHSVQPTLESDGKLTFCFDEINLEPQNNCSSNSFGFVSFRICPLQSAQHGDVIENSCNVQIGYNLPQISNTTWHTIYECGSEASFNLYPNPFCADSPINFESLNSLSDSLIWVINDQYHSSEAEWATSLGVGNYEVSLTAFSPLCDSITATAAVEVFAVPNPIISENGLTLTSSPAESYQWNFNGQIIDGATDQSYVVDEEGWYSVEVTNEFGCSAPSDEIYISVTEVDHIDVLDISVFPNPVGAHSVLSWPEQLNEVQIRIIDGTGKLVLNDERPDSNTMELGSMNLASGVYSVVITAVEGIISMQFMIP